MLPHLVDIILLRHHNRMHRELPLMVALAVERVFKFGSVLPFVVTGAIGDIPLGKPVRRQCRRGGAAKPQPRSLHRVSAQKCVHRPYVKLGIASGGHISCEKYLQNLLSVMIQLHPAQPRHQLLHAALVGRGTYRALFFPEIIVAGIDRRVAEGVTYAVKEVCALGQPEVMVLQRRRAVDIDSLRPLDYREFHIEIIESLEPRAIRSPLEFLENLQMLDKVEVYRRWHIHPDPAHKHCRIPFGHIQPSGESE